jgi:hypothetical protein
MTADSSTLMWKLQPSTSSRSFARAYIEIPEENTVITANVTALKPRVFSSKRSFRYSGTERAREP